MVMWTKSNVKSRRPLLNCWPGYVAYLLTMIVVLVFAASCTPAESGAGNGAAAGGTDFGKGRGTDSPAPNGCSAKNYGSPDFSCDCSHVNVDLPFNYTINSDQLLLQTDGGALKGFLSPWGAHVEPFTGHYAGNHKADWHAAYAGSYAEMTELTPSNRNGICEKGEACGVHRSKILEKQLKYIAPDHRFMITEVYVSKSAAYENEFQNGTGFRVYGWLCNYRFTFPYMRALGPVLREKMIAAGYVDPEQINETRADNLITGNPVVLGKGDVIGLLQIRAEAVQNHPDYFKGWGGMGVVPSSALEFTMDNLTMTGGYNAGIYRHLPTGLQDSLRDVFYAEGRKGENSIRFSDHMQNAWLWKAEMVLSASEPDLHHDYSSIFSWTGGWTELPASESCKSWEGKDCDEIFAIFKIHKDTPFYDVGLYDSPEVSYLVQYNKKKAGVQAGEVLSPSAPNALSGVLVIKWRAGGARYQKVAYRVEPQSKRMKLGWSMASDVLLNITDPSVPSESGDCDGETVVCLNHEPWKN